MAHAHQHMEGDGDGEIAMSHSGTKSTVHIVAGIEAHCQNIIGDASGDVMADKSYPQDKHPSVNCHAAPSAVSLPELVATSLSFHYLDVAYHAPSISFQSRTESPEIRPLHNDIRL